MPIPGIDANGNPVPFKADVQDFSGNTQTDLTNAYKQLYAAELARQPERKTSGLERTAANWLLPAMGAIEILATKGKSTGNQYLQSANDIRTRKTRDYGNWLDRVNQISGAMQNLQQSDYQAAQTGELQRKAKLASDQQAAIEEAMSGIAEGPDAKERRRAAILNTYAKYDPESFLKYSVEKAPTAFLPAVPTTTEQDSGLEYLRGQYHKLKDTAPEAAQAYAKQYWQERQSRAPAVPQTGATTNNLMAIDQRINQDPIIKKFQSQLSAADVVKQGLMMKNPIMDQAIKTQLARMMGEVGAMSNQDIERFGGSKSIQERIDQALGTATGGILSEDNRQYLLALTDTFQQSIGRQNNERLDAQAKKYGTIFKIPDDDLNFVTEPYKYSGMLETADSPMVKMAKEALADPNAPAAAKANARLVLGIKE
jgi:hypothetical protein